jgi:hypothetical protein
VATGNRYPGHAKFAFIKLTTIDFCYILRNYDNLDKDRDEVVAGRSFRRFGVLASLTTKTAKNSDRREQSRCSLACRGVSGPGFPRVTRARSLIICCKKQQKQRGA